MCVTLIRNMEIRIVVSYRAKISGLTVWKSLIKMRFFLIFCENSRREREDMDPQEERKKEVSPGRNRCRENRTKTKSP